MMMQGRNQKCNQLQSVIGIFLHSCRAPEKLINIFAHAGLSISASSILRAVKSLSVESTSLIRTMGEMGLCAIAYDNIDFQFSTDVPTVDSPGDKLVHLASALALKLDPGVKPEHLQCSDEVWDRQDIRLNPRATNPQQFVPWKTLERLAELQPQGLNHGMTRRDEFNTWVFVHTLLTHGPRSLRRLRSKLKDPPLIEGIPPYSFDETPLRAMNLNPASTGGNIEIVLNSLRQLGFGDPEQGLRDVGNRVQLIHGDLGTYEHLLSAIKQRSPEATRLDRLQFVVPIPGLFHLKMAAADAIWRIFVLCTKSTRRNPDETSFIEFLRILRPLETGKLSTKPTFRQQHEIIGDVGRTLRLDVWRVDIIKRFSGRFEDLEAYAASNPTIAELEVIARMLVEQYTAGGGVDLYAMEFDDPDNFDEQHRNIMLLHQLLLLYEELSKSMNDGDIGRIESVLVAFIPVFRATGKHKYSSRMLHFYHQLYFIYPEDLRCVATHQSTTI